MVVGTFGEGVAVFYPQEVLIAVLGITGMTRGGEAESCEGKVQSYSPLSVHTGFAGLGKLPDTSSLRRSAKNENTPSKQPLPG